MTAAGWIGVDFDGTLAEYDDWKGPDQVGPPIPAMIERVKRWLADGRDVRIFTARIAHDGTERRMMEADIGHEVVAEWCLKHIGVRLPITNVKDQAMIELWDDRVVQVIKNTGEPVGRSTRGLE